jgi:hypothetical protein
VNGSEFCHRVEDGPCTTDAYHHVCGRCGGDRRYPTRHEAAIRREAAIREAREGRDGDPFAGFPAEGQP